MTIVLLAAMLAAQAPASSGPPTPARPAPLWEPTARMAAQREAMAALAFLDGTWRGTAKAEEAPGSLTQTERVGPLLDGTVKLVEGRGYDAAGRTLFNALGIISYDPIRRAYSMRAYAQGYAGDYPLSVTRDGFSWTQPTGPGAAIRYTAAVRNGEWHEIGERTAPGETPAKIFEMRLRRIGPTGWPGESAVPRR